MPWFINILRWVLLPLVLPYQGALIIRHFLYDRHWLPVHKLPRPVISVGNIQLGGTGKTPLVMELLRLLEARGYRVAVLSRGYRRRRRTGSVIVKAGGAPDGCSWRLVGDEPWMIFRRLQRGVLGVGKNRYRVGLEVLRHQEVDLFLLDDGMQHRRLHRDVEICLVDVSRWSGGSLVFPFSFLRDVPQALQRATAIVLTKWENHSKKLASVKQDLRRWTSTPLLQGRITPVAIRKWPEGATVSREIFLREPCGAFCGIANPDHFLTILHKLHIRPRLFVPYPDHHAYREKDLRRLIRWGKQQGIRHFLTTEKDTVRIDDYRQLMEEETVAFYLVEVRFQLEHPERFWHWVEAGLGRRSRIPEGQERN